MRLRIAYVSPLNPTPNGISDYSEMLAPALAEHADLVLYSDCGRPSNPAIAERFVVRPVAHLARHRTEHDLRLYQFGNSPDHQSAFESFRRMPGVLTLHEPFLHHAYHGISRTEYIREAFYDRGVPDRAWASGMRQALVADDRAALSEVLLIGRLLDASLGIVVHSQAARRTVEDYLAARMRRSRVNVAVIPHPMQLDEVIPMREARVEFGLPVEGLVFGVPGMIHRTKEPDLILTAFADVARQLPGAHLVFIGQIDPHDNWPATAKQLGVAQHVTFLDRVDPVGRMHRAMAACDVLINLRKPSLGETSGTAMRALALGRPVVVRDAGWYHELPHDTCARIGASAGAAELSELLLALAKSADARQALGETARRYIQSHCSVTTVAGRYAVFLEGTYDYHVKTMASSYPRPFTSQ